MSTAFVSILEDVKEHEGELEMDEYTVTYDKDMETGNVATFGPWSIEGKTENIPESGVNALGAILDGIREVERNS